MGKVVQEGRTKATVLDGPDTGVFDSRLFRAGTYDIVVTVPNMGPIPANGGAVSEGPWKRRITFRPNAQFDAGETRQVVPVVMALRNPIIKVRFFDLGLSSVPLAGAEVEVIGVSLGQTDAEGRFSSGPVPFGRRGVRVSAPNLSPTTQAGPVFFREVELREKGTLDNTPDGRNLELQVNFSSAGAVDLPGTHPRPLRVWVSGGNTPHTVTDEPALPNPGAGDVPAGQDGWDFGLRYGSPWLDVTRRLNGGETLPDELGGGTIAQHQIKRLAFVAHGAPGISDVDQKLVSSSFGAQPAPELRLPSQDSATTTSPSKTSRRSCTRTESCSSPRAPWQTSPLERSCSALSRRWPTIRVVGSRTILSTTTFNRHDKPGTSQMFAGLRDTPFKLGGTGATQTPPSAP